MKKNEFILYGLEGYKDIISRIINDLKIYDMDFEIKLILTEALTNAFKHGNKGDKEKPIYLRYSYSDDKIIFEIEDSGKDLDSISIPDSIPDDKILSDCGRGLFLIKNIANNLVIKNNSLIIEINCRGRMEDVHENKFENKVNDNVRSLYISSIDYTGGCFSF